MVAATGNLPSVTHIPAAPSWSGVPDCPLPLLLSIQRSEETSTAARRVLQGLSRPRRTHSLASGQKRLESFHAYSLTELLGEPAPPARRSRPSGEPAPAASRRIPAAPGNHRTHRQCDGEALLLRVGALPIATVIEQPGSSSAGGAGHGRGCR